MVRMEKMVRMHQLFLSKILLNQKTKPTRVNTNTISTPTRTDKHPVQAFSGGGPVNSLMSMKQSSKKKSLGTDTVPAMLTPGEFVMSKEAVDKIGIGNLMQMNKEGGGTINPMLYLE